MDMNDIEGNEMPHDRVDRTDKPGWVPLIQDPDRRAAIASVIVEIVEAVEASRRDDPASSDIDYAMLRFYVATDATVPDPGDTASAALTAAVAGIADRRKPGLSAASRESRSPSVT